MNNSNNSRKQSGGSKPSTSVTILKATGLANEKAEIVKMVLKTQDLTEPGHNVLYLTIIQSSFPRVIVNYLQLPNMQRLWHKLV